MGGGRAWSRAVRLGAGAIAAVALAGCSLFFPGYTDFEELPEPDENPAVVYTRGSATIEVDGATATLDEVSDGSGEWTDFGASVTWRGGDWVLQLSGASGEGFGGSFGFDGYLTVHRIGEGRHWMTLDPSRCIVTVERLDKDGLAGSATCRGLEWVDAISSEFVYEPPTIEGEDPFDAEITFEAGPAPRST